MSNFQNGGVECSLSCRCSDNFDSSSAALLVQIFSLSVQDFSEDHGQFRITVLHTSPLSDLYPTASFPLPHTRPLIIHTAPPGCGGIGRRLCGVEKYLSKVF